MILRPRQVESVQKANSALKQYGNTLIVVPTGGGKTVILSKIAGAFKCVLILQHRDELIQQNLGTFLKVNPQVFGDVFTASRKRILKTGATFAMVQTMMRPQNLERIIPFDLIIIDEAHHAPARGYREIIDRCKQENPNLKILGVTATPMRADKKAMIDIFNNVCDVVRLAELIKAGHLVRPRVYVIDSGLREDLNRVRVTASDFDMDEVGKIMDKMAINSRVVEEWKTHAKHRSTVVFCSTVEHATHVSEAFKDAGVLCEMVHGSMPDAERRAVLRRLDNMETQVVVNVAVLTEGFDCQPVSCVILLRPCSHKSTMLQMIGRGLRKLDASRYPGILKDDCIVLDFGYSILTHGNLDVEPDLSPERRTRGPMPCKNCGCIVPPEVNECPVCGQLLFENTRGGGEGIERGDLEEFKMTEVDLLELSPYRWEEVWDGALTVANALNSWAVCLIYKKRWFAIGGLDKDAFKDPARLLANAPSRMEALSAADDFLRDVGDQANAKKTESWLSLPATDRQLYMLGLDPISAFGTNRYRATCLITWRQNETKIRAAVEQAYINTASQIEVKEEPAGIPDDDLIPF